MGLNPIQILEKKLLNFQNTKKLNKERPPISSLVRWKDHHFLVMDKPAGMPVQEDQTGDMSLWRLGKIYSKIKIHVATRLDRPVNGLVIFCKNPESIKYLESLKAANKFEKYYLALVEGRVTQNAGLIESNLKHDKHLRKAIIAENEDDDYKKAKLEFELLHHLDNYSLLRIKIETGRFHQIRAQLANFGFPIKGDVKYGARRSNEDKSIYLCCHEIKFMNKAKSKQIHCFAKLPSSDNLWSLTKEIIDGRK